MNLAELPEDSDTSDEDYCPEGKPQEVVSEVDSDGDPEDHLSDTEDLGKRGQKRKKKLSKKKSKQKKIEEEAVTEKETEDVEETEEEKKKKEEDLWADFMKDTGFKSKNSKNSINSPKPKTESKPSESPKPEPKKTVPEKVKITQIFEFAGEEVRVEKEVASDSAEARLLSNQPSKSSDSKPVPARARGGLGGISNVLSQLGKKAKISTLEKTKLDWDKFKKDEKIDEELQTYNKGKDGYLERQDFLQRTDLRRFEIEKEVRGIERNKRLNMNNPL